MSGHKKKVFLLTVILLFATVMLLSGCFSTNNNPIGGSYSVSVNLNGGTGINAEDFISGSKLVEPTKQPTKKGCDFLGWYFDAEFKVEAEFDIQIKKNITIYAKWSEFNWTVTLVFGGGKDNIYVKVADKAKVTLPETLPTINGYQISGWYKEAAWTNKFSFTELIEDDISIYAKWEIVNYTISYVFDKGEPNINTVYTYTINNSVALYDPTVIGYEFLGWYDNENFQGEAVTTISKGSYGNKTFYAKYLGLKKDIERTMLGATILENNPEAGKGTIIINVNHAREELTLNNSNIIVSDRASFAVFQNEEETPNNVFDLSAVHADGEEQYAQISAKIIVTSEKGEEKEYILYIRKYAEGELVRVDFNTGVAPSIGYSEILIGETVEEPELQAVEGYIFDGWYQEETFINLFDFDSSIGNDITIYAKLTPIPYAINYYVGIGSNPVGNPISYTLLDDITLENGENTLLYNFVGWYSEKEFINKITEINDSIGDITLYAKYVLKNDTSAIAANFGGAQTFEEEDNLELKAYLEYLVFSRAEQASFILNLNGDANVYSDYLNNVWQSMEVPKSTVSWGANLVGSNQVDMTFTYSNYPSAMASTTDGYTQLDYILHEEYTPQRTVDFDGFKINSIGNTVSVTTSEQLFYALSQGYRPLPASGSKAESLYNKAKVILRAIIDDSMDDVTKLHKIYDYIILNVVYDKDLLELAENNPQGDTIHSFNGFYLEGVFDDKRAVCDGISKAFLVLARIEGIETYQITYVPEDNSPGHAWNKVRLDGKYYVIDATSGGAIVGQREGLTHKYFLISDAKFKELTQKNIVGEANYFAGYEASDHLDKVANSDDYDVYNEMSVTIGAFSYNLRVESEYDLDSLISAIADIIEDYEGAGFSVDIYIDFDYGADIADELAGGKISYSYSFERGYLLLIFVIN